MKYKAAFFSDMPWFLPKVYGLGRKESLEKELNFYPEIVTSKNYESVLNEIDGIEFIFSTWGMLPLTEEQISKFKNLKAVFYAAGSVRYFCEPFFKKGIKVISAWIANGYPVAEYTMAQILLATKGYFAATRICRSYEGRKNYINLETVFPGNFEVNVSLLGAGGIGKNLIKLLKPFRLNILVFDPFLSETAAKELGVTKVSLEEAFKNSIVVSNHIADIPATKKMITKEMFRSMMPNATFINTGRGGTVDEEGMLDVLEERKDITALIDVTEPEPPQEDSRLLSLENVFLSPHIAGTIGREVVRNSDSVIEEYHRFKNGEPMKYVVTPDMLKTMA
jgi:phosphoglycerate dehydrogenase-like enzyme